MTTPSTHSSSGEGDREAALFAMALEQPAVRRHAFLERACGADTDLLARLQALLAAHSNPDEPLAVERGPGERSTMEVRLPLPADFLVGQKIGRYKILEKLGEGGCGVVFAAEQITPVRRRVAVKVIKLGMDTAAVVARFEAERQALAMMDHPHIAKVFDAGVTEDITFQSAPDSKEAAAVMHKGRPYFVMELVRGIPITTYCDQQNLSMADRVALFIKVCHAIQHAHQKGIIHRDIKPSNILVTLHDGVPVPKVIDFGIAKATEGRLTDSTIYTQLHQFIGTPAYMSPEQAEMSGLDIDTRSDIYSLGVVLYELLAGSTPFNPRELLAAGLDAMRKTIRESEPPRPSTRLATLQGNDLSAAARRRAAEAPRLIRMLQGDLDWIAMKCLEKDRTRRYESASGLAADLKRHIDNEPVIARAPTAAYRLQKTFRRNRAAFAVGAALLGLLLIGLWAATASWQRERFARTRAQAAERNQFLARAEAEEAGRVATVERDRAAVLLSLSQAETGVRLLEQDDPVGLLHLVESRKSVEHLAEERIRRTILWSGWMNSMPRPQTTVTPLPPQIGDWQQLLGINLDQTTRLPWRATGTTNGEVVLWDDKTGQQRASFNVKAGPVFVAEMSGDGRLVMANAGGRFQLWDCAPVHSNAPPRRLLGKILRFAFDSAGSRIVTYADQGLPEHGDAPDGLPAPEAKVQIWDSTVPDALVATWNGDRSDLSNHHFALTSDGSKVITGWESLKQWDARSGREIAPTMRVGLPGKGRRLTDELFISPDGKWLWEVSGSTCQRYDLGSGQPVGEPITDLHRWNRPTVGSGGEHLILPLRTGFSVVRFESGERVGPPITRDDNTMRPMALSADGARLATAGPEQGLRVWDTRTGRQLGKTLVMPVRIASASFSPDGHTLSMVGDDRQLRVQSLTPQPSTWVNRWEGVKIIGFDPKGDALTYQIRDRTLAWRRPAIGGPTAAWSAPDPGLLMGSALRSDGAVAATAFQTGKEHHSVIRLWDAVRGTQIGPAITWTNVGALAFSPDGLTLAGLSGADGSGSIQLWDAATGQPRAFLLGEPMQTSWLSLRFSPDGRFAAARNSYVTTVWDLAAGVPVGARGDFYMAISADWRWALGKDLVDFTDPRQPKAAPHPPSSSSNPVAREGFALSSDGLLRLSSGVGKSVRIWNNVIGRSVGKELTMTNHVRQAAFSPDSRLVLTYESRLGSVNPNAVDTVRLWETSAGLPCGPAAPVPFLPTEFLFDAHTRFLAIPAPFETTTSLMISLPEREIPLVEMQRQSALLAGSRLDESGTVVPLTTSELADYAPSQPTKNPTILKK